VVVDVSATVIEIAFTAAGDVSSFGDAELATLRQNLRATLGCHEPECLLTLHLSAGSVHLEATLTIPDAPTAEGNNESLAVSIEVMANELVAQPLDEISSALGVDVSHMADVTTGYTIVPLVRAPPPPPNSITRAGSLGIGGLVAIAVVAVAIVIGAGAFLHKRKALRASTAHLQLADESMAGKKPVGNRGGREHYSTAIIPGATRGGEALAIVRQI